MTTFATYFKAIHRLRLLMCAPEQYSLKRLPIIVVASNAPPKPDKAGGLKGWLMGLSMKKAGAAGSSANRITLLRDTNSDGIADVRATLLQGLNSPFGMALIGNDLFVANTDSVVRFAYSPGATQITAAGVKVVDIPGGPINHHWTKNLIASPDGSKLYVTVGSNSNVAERGMAVEVGRAAIWEVDVQSGAHRVYGVAAARKIRHLKSLSLRQTPL
jgi:glucose/arabinose dehydrogenase